MDQELVETKEALKRVTDEMERMRNDNDKMRNEMDELRSLRMTGIPVQFALGFRPQEYLAMSYVKSAEWVAGPLTTRMKALMQKYPANFEGYTMLGGGLITWGCVLVLGTIGGSTVQLNGTRMRNQSGRRRGTMQGQFALAASSGFIAVCSVWRQLVSLLATP